MSTLSEFALIERFFQRPGSAAVLGIGDDAALLAPTPGCELAVSVDMLVSGRHFFADVDPEALGHKTLAVNLSDMAAMGAKPRWALLAGALPGADERWLAGFARGLFALADRYGVELVGGDTTRGPLNLCVTIIGEAPAGEAMRRSGARGGDEVWISGELGSAALALAHHLGRGVLDPAELEACETALLRPVPRVALGERLRGIATSAIDISDGLVGDLEHVAAASGAGARIDLARIPRGKALERRLSGDERALAVECLLAGGDDYELCFTAPPHRTPEIVAASAALGTRLTCIGRMVEGRGVVVLDEHGAMMPALPQSFDHFA